MVELSQTLIKDEFPFSDNDFEKIRGILLEHTGIALPDTKRNMMYSRLVRRLRKLELTSFVSYISHVEKQISSGGSEELLQMINALTTNVTNFFREHHHFDSLIVEMEKLVESGKKEVRIWSAGCSTGQEPYTIAMVVDSFLEKHPDVSVKIVASDLDTAVIEQAKQGMYTLDRTEVNNHPYLKKYLTFKEEALSTLTPNDAVFQVADKLKEYIEFKQINLVKPWSHSQKFDFIFCRNVMIYFNTETKNDLCRRYIDNLNIGGILFIGHSEAIKTEIPNISALGGTAYRKNS